jgi:hypothetical protein
VRSHVLAVDLHGRHSIRSRFGAQGRLVTTDNKDFQATVNDESVVSSVLWRSLDHDHDLPLGPAARQLR